MIVDIARLIFYLTMLVGFAFGQVPWWVLVAIAGYDVSIYIHIPWFGTAKRKAALMEAYRKQYLAEVMGQVPNKEDLH